MTSEERTWLLCRVSVIPAILVLRTNLQGEMFLLTPTADANLSIRRKGSMVWRRDARPPKRVVGPCFLGDHQH